jgi:hypothetical protein
MSKFLRKLLKLCDHEWENHNKQNYVETSFGMYLAFTIIQCKCKKCGVWKSFKIMW